MVTKKQQKTQTQIQRANDVLFELKQYITTQDREDAQRVLKLGPATVLRYTNREAKKLDTALALIKFFRGKIDKRERELQGVA